MPYVICSFQLTCLCHGLWWVMSSTAKIRFQSSTFIVVVWHCDIYKDSFRRCKLLAANIWFLWTSIHTDVDKHCRVTM